MPIERFEELEVWKLAHHLVLDVYKTTDLLPRDRRLRRYPHLPPATYHLQPPLEKR